MKPLLGSILVLLVVACGKSGVEPQNDTSPARLESLSVKFEPDTKGLGISGRLQKLESQAEFEFFYFTGTLGSELSDPIDGRKLSLQCEEADCRNFSFSLVGKRLSLSDEVKVRLLPVASARPELGERNGNQTFPSVWHELLSRGVQAPRSSVALSTWDDKTFFGILLAGATDSRTHWLHVSALTGSDKIQVNYSHQGDTGPEYTLGTEPGTIGSDGPTPWAISFPGGKLLVQTGN